jgi:hypothetical protein
MSLRRVAAAAAVVLLAVLVAPAAIQPGFNSGDLIVVLAPFALLHICMPRALKTPAGERNVPRVDDPHVEAPPAGPLT